MYSSKDKAKIPTRVKMNKNIVHDSIFAKTIIEKHTYKHLSFRYKKQTP